MPRPAESRSVVVHRPGMSPLFLPPDATTEDTLADLLIDLGLLQPEGSLRLTNPTPAQVGSETHYLLLTPQEALAHPPLAQFWTTPCLLRSCSPFFAALPQLRFWKTLLCPHTPNGAQLTKPWQQKERGPLLKLTRCSAPRLGESLQELLALPVAASPGAEDSCLSATGFILAEHAYCAKEPMVYTVFHHQNRSLIGATLCELSPRILRQLRIPPLKRDLLLRMRENTEKLTSRTDQVLCYKTGWKPARTARTARRVCKPWRRGVLPDRAVGVAE